MNNSKIRRATLSVTNMVQSGQTQWQMSLEDATVEEIKQVFDHTLDKIDSKYTDDESDDEQEYIQ